MPTSDETLLKTVTDILKLAVEGNESVAESKELLSILRGLKGEFLNLLHKPPPDEGSNSKVRGKNVELSDGSKVTLNNQLAQIALKLSEDYSLNEISCVELVIDAHDMAQELQINLSGNEAVNKLRLAAGIWMCKRAYILNVLLMLLQFVATSNTGKNYLYLELQSFLKEIIDAGLRKRILNLIDELGNEDSSGLGGPSAHPFLLDGWNNVVPRAAAVHQQRLYLVRCLLFASQISTFNSEEALLMFGIVKKNFDEYNITNDAIHLQIAYTALFGISVFLGLEATADSPPSTVAKDEQFKKTIGEQMLSAQPTSYKTAVMTTIMFFWGIFLNKAEERDGQQSAFDKTVAEKCWDVVLLDQSFRFLAEVVIESGVFQSEDPDISAACLAGLNRLLCCFFSMPKAQNLLSLMKKPPPRSLSNIVTFPPEHCQACLSSLLNLIGVTYEMNPSLSVGNTALWNFANFIGQNLQSYDLMAAFLGMLAHLASSPSGAGKVYTLLAPSGLLGFSWHLLSDTLKYYDKHLHGNQISSKNLLAIPEGHLQIIHAYLDCFTKVVSQVSSEEVAHWFPDVEPLYLLLQSQRASTDLKASLRLAITAWVKKLGVVAKSKVDSSLSQLDLPLKAKELHGRQMYDMEHELSVVESRQELYPSVISYLKLQNALMELELKPLDEGRKYKDLFVFVSSKVFCRLGELGYKDMGQKWELAAASLHHFMLLLKMHKKTVDGVSILSAAQAQKASESPPPGQLLLEELFGSTKLSETFFGTLCVNPDALVAERRAEKHGEKREEAVRVAWQLLLAVLDLEKGDESEAPLDFILMSDSTRVWSLLDFVRYSSNHEIRLCAIRFLAFLSENLPSALSVLGHMEKLDQFVTLFTCCVSQVFGWSSTDRDNDRAFLTAKKIVEFLLKGVSRTRFNLCHALLGFSSNMAVGLPAHGALSKLLDFLQFWDNGDGQWREIYEACLHMCHRLATNPLTRTAMQSCLHSPQNHLFSPLLSGMMTEILPATAQGTTRPEVGLKTIASSLHQRAWLLKLLSLNVHTAELESVLSCAVCRSLVCTLIDVDIEGQFYGKFDASKSAASSMIQAILDQLLDVPTAGKIALSSSLKNGLIELGFLGQDNLLPPPKFQAFSERGKPVINSKALLAAWRQKDSQQQQAVNGGLTAGRVISPTFFELGRWIRLYNVEMELREGQAHAMEGWSQLAQMVAMKGLAVCSSVEEKKNVIASLLATTLDSLNSPAPALVLRPVAQVVSVLLMKLKDVMMEYADMREPAVESDRSVKRLAGCVYLLTPLVSKILDAALREDADEIYRSNMHSAILWMVHFFEKASEYLSDWKFQEAVTSTEDVSKAEWCAQLTWLLSACVGKLNSREEDLAKFLGRDASGGQLSATFLIWSLITSVVRILGMYGTGSDRFVRVLDSADVLKKCADSVASVTETTLQGPKFFLVSTQLNLLLQVALWPGPEGVEILSSQEVVKRISWGAVITNLRTSMVKSSHSYQRPDWSSSSLYEFVHGLLRLFLALSGYVSSLDVDDKCRRKSWLTVLWNNFQELLGSHEEFFSLLLVDPLLSDSPPSPRLLRHVQTFRMAVHFVTLVLSDQRIRGQFPKLNAALSSLSKTYFGLPANVSSQPETSLGFPINEYGNPPSRPFSDQLEAELVHVKLSLITHMQTCVIQSVPLEPTQKLSSVVHVDLPDLIAALQQHCSAILVLKTRLNKLRHVLSNLSHVPEFELDRLIASSFSSESSFAPTFRNEKEIAAWRAASNQVGATEEMLENHMSVVERGLELLALARNSLDRRTVSGSRKLQTSLGEADALNLSSLFNKVEQLFDGGEAVSTDSHLKLLLQKLKGSFALEIE